MMNVSAKYAESDLITPEQSREISMMALQKGAALQRLVNVTSRNGSSVKAMKNALFMLKVYAFGDEHQPTINSMEQKGSFRFSQVQLKLLRQEQLMLLSENQRLVDELQKIRKMNLSSLSVPAPRAPESHGGAKNSKLVKSIDRALMGDNEANLVRSKLLYLVATLDRVRHRKLASAFRRISLCDKRDSVGQTNYVNPHKYYTLTKKAACVLLENVLRTRVRAQKHSALNTIRNYSKFTPPKGNLPQTSPKIDKEVMLISAHQVYQNQLPSVRRHMMNS
ncbi:conserved hypothetical protein [Theileria orientalis strain Shintoku]|uniref:Uncharacterized protein n=1 Tax=Theileria orientalis strain Shintoku TaxID=869250 RepID=J4DPS3_THEOR|nr:conserved hypothetical protein [Theileria orientalis strain Shintoku]PVC52750.1 hypothetical protein MACL_00000512 [Theileria orientalis]BAM41204.1 conserved hypothetical protein [Theileria orientalis strain Shintoku]|eukprot:XP_009691505.1 conserved hypothetical protein [Theileria orientalis strain Shintoku]